MRFVVFGPECVSIVLSRLVFRRHRRRADLVQDAGPRGHGPHPRF